MLAGYRREANAIMRTRSKMTTMRPASYLDAPRRLACLCAILLLSLMSAAVLAAPAHALGSAFDELTGEGRGVTSTSSTVSLATTESPASNSSGVVVIALGAVVVLLIAIAFLIVRDARGMAPVGDGFATGASSGSPQDAAARLRKRRAKAKAARRQRKRNR
jgi:hypothetical protein